MLVRAQMTVHSVGAVGPSRKLQGKCVSRHKNGTQYFFDIFLRTTRVSVMIRTNNDVYVPSPHTAETSPHDHPDLWRGFPDPLHACKALWDPNCSAEVKKIINRDQNRRRYSCSKTYSNSTGGRRGLNLGFACCKLVA